MVPASRLVTEASLEPADSIDRRRASRVAGKSVAGGGVDGGHGVLEGPL